MEKVPASFAVSYNKLDPDNQPMPWRKTFLLASWFAPVSINRELLAASARLKHNAKDSRHQADDALTRLKELGLIKEEADARLLLHRLLRELPDSTTEDMVREEAINAVGKNLCDFAVREHESGLPKALARTSTSPRHRGRGRAGRPGNRCKAYRYLGLNGRELALFREAKADQEKGLQIAEMVYGPDDQEVAVHANDLGLVFWRLGDPAEARTCIEGAEDRRSGSRTEPCSSVYWANNLGLVLLDFGYLASARTCFERS